MCMKNKQTLQQVTKNTEGVICHKYFVSDTPETYTVYKKEILSLSCIFHTSRITLKILFQKIEKVN